MKIEWPWRWMRSPKTYPDRRSIKDVIQQLGDEARERDRRQREELTRRLNQIEAEIDVLRQKGLEP